MTRAVRVLLVIDSLTPEAGTENQLIEMVRRTDRAQVELFVACLEDGERLRALAPYATPMVFPAPGAFSLAGLKQMYRLRREIRRRAIDIVHTYMPKATIFAVLASLGSGARVVLTSRRNLGYWYTGRLLALFRVLNRLTTRVVANSEGARIVAVRSEGLPPDRVDVIHNGVDMARFDRAADRELAARLGIPATAHVVGIVANFRPVKNLPMFLRAASLVARRVPDACFLLVGRGQQRAALQELAASLGIADRVIITDDQGDVAAFYPLFHVACLTSRSEGFSNAILEYMAAGLPVIATDVGGIGEAVVDGVTGLLVPSDDEKAFAEAIVGLLLEPERRAAMGRRGRERCAERFEIGKVVRAYEQYYRGLLEAPLR
jgi:glycosyltransferase involved in cell wall biosynthesis